MAKTAKSARDNFRAFMDGRDLKPHPWATKAGIRSSTLYNFLAGKSDSLSTDTLQKLAKAAGATVDEILGGTLPRPKPKQATVSVTAVVGVHGRLFAMEEHESIARPPGIPDDVEVLAARIDGDGLHPIPGGWLVLYEARTRSPTAMLKKLAVVKVAGKPNLMVREIRRGSTAGLFTLIGWGTAAVEDVEIDEAHLILSIVQP